MQNKLISIDWFQINVTSKFGCENISLPSKYTLRRLDYSTKVFRIVEEIYAATDRICTLTRIPISSIIPAETILIKFDNWVLYKPDLHQFITRFLKECHFNFRSISRVDIALDFQRFDNGEYPENFIQKVASKRLIKTGRSKCQTIMTQGQRPEYEYLKLGTNNSAICYYLYNKTKELEQAKDKPYIRDRWLANGYDISQPTWRLEFSLKSVTKDLVDTETGLKLQLKDLEILKTDHATAVFNTLLNHYWVWYKVPKKGVQKVKSRMKLYRTLDVLHTPFILYPKTVNKQNSRADKIFIKKLNALNNELRLNKKELDENITTHLLHEFAHSRGLISWANKKQLLPNPIDVNKYLETC